MKRVSFTLLSVIVLVLCGLTSCRNTKDGDAKGSGLNGDSIVPILSPEASISAMQLEKGFSVKLVAAEPLISTPVAMSFDDSMRLWVVEMSDYHPIQEDSTQDYPLGRVVILTDTDRDGLMDSSKVFIDSLVMPRAICLIDNGLLLVTPPNLWYIPINEDCPGKKIRIDSAYAVSNNPEGQTNGLMRSIDNWIYSAGFGSGKRYRKMNGRWYTEKTRVRGQWGISQDDYGRLFYNNNSQNLLGDFFLPGVTSVNKYQKKVAGFNRKIVPDNRVYPAGPTLAVNRGYRKGILDDSQRLVHFTAACGPLIYRGGLFPPDYAGNAFVCEPAANLIKRNIIRKDGFKITGKQANQGREFLASTDKRFRPVSLYDGPDGALYVIDMYRGVIQDKLSLTDYLEDYSVSHGLNQPANCGRIYKIIPAGKAPEAITIPHDPIKLVGLLSHKNGWIRDRAQQKLVDDHDTPAEPFLRKLLNDGEAVIPRIHALWTLEGLHRLYPGDVVHLLEDEDIHMRMQALAVLTNELDAHNYNAYLPAIKKMVSGSDSLEAPYVAYALGKLAAFSPGETAQLRKKLIEKYPANSYVIDAVISGLQGNEEAYVNRYKKSVLFHRRLDQVLKNKNKLKQSADLEVLKKKYPEGYAIFEGTCQTCHGADGNGIEFIAPPLNGSDWVKGDKDKLIKIVVYGLSGPVKVAGKMYKRPEVTGEMPGFGNHKFSDKAMAEVLSFIRQAWSNQAGDVKEDDIKTVRRQCKERKESFTMEELLKTNG